MSLVDDIRWIQRAVGAEPDGVFGPRTAQAVMLELSSRGRNGMMRDDSPLEIDERTRTNLDTLDPKARERFEQLVLLGKATAATFGCDWVMISGHRTWEEQDALYQKRPKVTNARGGYSNHNFGIAGDFAVFRGKSYLDNADPKTAAQVHAAIAVHARKLGFEWGGDWKSLKDYPHFEISTGLTMAQKRKLYKERGSVL
jgi:peptidoglycan L-alanyl-D-glutamate endopeptidase CwlK